MGLCFVSIGLYCSVLCSSLVVPFWKDDEEEKKDAAGTPAFADEDENQVPDSDTWQPVMWKRAHLIWANITLQFFLLWVWEFSYSETFSENVYLFIVVFKAIQMLMDLLMESILRE